MVSRICIYDLDRGAAVPVLDSEELIEAPNWTPDGAALIVNGGGRLYRIPLDAPALEPIDTGFAQRLNNDHGLSPDGTRIALTDKTETGESCIYLMPAGGGVPVRVTENVPSYWHGWSPDGATLVYTARRDGAFDVHTIPVTGGQETRLTEGFEHADGPDYTPDGAWIWFNGQREGRMALWRMRPDGTGLERMTSGPGQDWFPHPSPDGKWVLFVAYAPGTEEHPRDRDVSLRLVPAEGGAERVLLELFGGQGTINVPCWAPDGRRFAFMETLRG